MLRTPINMTELEQYIKSYFEVIEQGDLQTISSLFRLTTIRKGEYFLKTGKTCDKLCFIQSGLLRIFIPKDGKEVTQWISTPGSLVADLSSLVFESPARFTIQALGDCVRYIINGEDYKKIGNLVPKWHELETLFMVKCFIILEDRIFSHLSMTAEERYDLFFANNRELFNQVPLQYIASMLGMTPETFSRIRKKRL